MIRAMGWMVVAYLFGIVGFGLSELGDQWGGNDLGSMLSEALAAGLRWPLTLYNIITGNFVH